jgi:hypothetical protein
MLLMRAAEIFRVQVAVCPSISVLVVVMLLLLGDFLQHVVGSQTNPRLRCKTYFSELKNIWDLAI